MPFVVNFQYQLRDRAIEQTYAASRLPSLTSFCKLVSMPYHPVLMSPAMGSESTYQSLHSAVQRMSMVSPELGVGAFERWVTVGLRLFDAREEMGSAVVLANGIRAFCRSGKGCRHSPVPVGFLRLIVLRGVL
jgi:hypothetical protein